MLPLVLGGEKIPRGPPLSSSRGVCRVKPPFLIPSFLICSTCTWRWRPGSEQLCYKPGVKSDDDAEPSCTGELIYTHGCVGAGQHELPGAAPGGRAGLECDDEAGDRSHRVGRPVRPGSWHPLRRALRPPLYPPTLCRASPPPPAALHRNGHSTVPLAVRPSGEGAVRILTGALRTHRAPAAQDRTATAWSLSPAGELIHTATGLCAVYSRTNWSVAVHPAACAAATTDPGTGSKWAKDGGGAGSPQFLKAVEWAPAAGSVAGSISHHGLMVPQDVPHCLLVPPLARGVVLPC